MKTIVGLSTNNNSKATLPKWDIPLLTERYVLYMGGKNAKLSAKIF